MRIGFYSLGMPHWPVTEFAAQGRKHGYDFVVFRISPADQDRPLPGDQISLGMSASELDGIKRVFNQAGFGILSLHAPTGGGGFLRVDSDKIDWDAVTADIASHVKVAARLGCEQIRVQVERADKQRHAGWKWDWDDYLLNLGRASLAAVAGTNVSAVYQNHVGAASAKQLLRMVEKIGDRRLGVSFSPDHCVVMQEDPVQLAADHAQSIANVVVADRKVVEENLGEFDGRYYYVRYEACTIGEGIVPLKRIFDTLEGQVWGRNAYLKWERRPDALPNAKTGEVGDTPRFGWQLQTGDVALESFLPFMKTLGYAPSKKARDVG
jgi:sugar phosphate isomerase/epimerase